MTGAFFDSFYARDPVYYGTDVRPEYLAFLDGLGSAEPAILDLGAGQGRHAVVAARRGARVTAVDYSELGTEQLAALAKSGGLPVTGADVAKLLTIAFGTVALGLFLERSPRRGRKRRDVQPDDGPDDQERES